MVLIRPLRGYIAPLAFAGSFFAPISSDAEKQKIYIGTVLFYMQSNSMFYKEEGI